jgi:hypothetical protein
MAVASADGKKSAGPDSKPLYIDETVVIMYQQ